MDVQVIKDCQYLYPNMHSGKMHMQLVDHIAEEVFSCLSNKKIIKVFVKLFNQYDLCNVVLREFTEFSKRVCPTRI